MKKIPLFFLLITIFFLSCGQYPYQDKALPVDQRVEDLLNRMTLEEKIDMIGGYNSFNIKPLARLHIPEIHMSDGPVGVRNYGKSTAYPASLGLAASWNTKLAQKVGASIGKEAKAKNVHIMLGPAMNIHRGPFCGRNFEYLGEDPFLAGEIASNFIIGLQDQGVMATAKHYVANYQDFDRHRVSSNMSERTLREIYLPAFKASVQKGKVAAIMTAYNLVNDVHCSQNSFLNNTILKDEWGFKGFIMSDWTSTYESVGAANGGLDLEMPYGKYMNKDSLLPAIAAGKVSKNTIDDKIRRMLRMVISFGYLDQPNIAYGFDVSEKETGEIALEAARESIVLLKNKNILPLNKNKIRSIAVLGPNATYAVTGGGGSSFVEARQSTSLAGGIRNLVGEQIEILVSAGPFETFPPDFYQHNNDFFSVVDNEKRSGLKGVVFRNMEFKGEPVATRFDEAIDFNFGKYIADGILCDQVSARWSGKIQPAESGPYKFVLSGDDGYRLFIDGKIVIEEWRDQADKTVTKILKLQGNRVYDIRLEYYQNHGGATFRFAYEKYDKTKENVAYQYAKKADVVIAGVGFSKETEGEGSDRTYPLPGGQEAFLNKILSLNKNTIVVLNAGGNVDMHSWLPKTKALLHAFYPGQEGGNAIAEIIFGKTNPSAKLPVSFEARWEDNPTYHSYFDDDGDKKVIFSEGIFLGYRYYDTKNVKPLFPFGFGLSYSTFEYSNLQVIPGEEQSYKIKFKVKNKSERSGKEVVQIYVSDLKSSVDRPAKEMKGFSKIDLQPGESKMVEIGLPASSFSYFSEKEKKWLIEPGEFKILVGSSSRDIRLSEKIKL